MSVSLEAAIDFNDGKKDIPIEFTQSMIHSNDLDVLKKVQREIIPRELSSFGYQTAAGVVSNDTLSNKLTFYASDPRYYMDMLNSYFTADFKAVAETAANVDLPSFMDVGGVHACIKTLTIKIGGTILMRLDDYNKWYNINNLATHSAEYSDYMLASSLDSQDDFSFLDSAPSSTAIAFTAGAGNSITNAGVLTLVGSTLLTSVKVGDQLHVVSTIGAVAGIIQTVTVLSIATNLAINVSGSIKAVTGADADNCITAITIIRRQILSTRASVVNQAANVKVQWRLPVGCLSYFKYFPLPYIQNISPLEVEFEFVQPQLALVLRDAAAAAVDNRLGYLISRPRWVAMLVEPSNKVREMHDMVYSANGLWFPYVNYRHFQSRIGANETDNTFTFQTNISSARHVFSVITSQANDDSATLATQAVKSQSTFYRSSLNYFRFQSGSLQFPDYGNCVTSDIWASEAWAQLLLAFNIKENTVHKSRIRPYEWQSTSSEKFIIATPLSKDETMFCGTSLKNNFLELIVNKAGVATAYNLHTYLGYDAALVISKANGALIFD